MKKVRNFLGMALLLVWGITSCQQEGLVEDDKVILVVNLGSPEVIVKSRAEADNDLVDGNCFYRVTMLIVDESKKLVAMKDWTDIQTTLPYNVSTTIRELEPNTTYQMIVIANYSAYGLWGGLTNFPNISNLTIGSNISTTIAALNSYVLPTAGDDYVVGKNPQPLTLVQEFTTPAEGKLEVGGELIRTYARLRIEVSNRSENYSLSVNSLKFGSTTSKFGYKTEPLMMVSDNQIPASDGNLNEASSDAITPFIAMEVPALHDEAGNMKVAFDGYLYECKNTAGFEYTLNVGYPIQNTTTKTVYQKGYGTTTPSSGLYMIGYGDNHYYLTANNNGVGVIQNTKSQLDPNQDKPVIWEVTKGNYNYKIKRYDENSYLSVSSNTVVLSSSGTALTIADGKIRTYYTSYNNYYYMNINGNGISTTSRQNAATTFTFYPLEQTTIDVTGGGTATKEFTIPLETIVDGVAEQTHIIRRNDFIDVLVTVSYNENTGKIDFHVEDWSKKEGNVEFN